MFCTLNDLLTMVSGDECIEVWLHGEMIYKGSASLCCESLSKFKKNIVLLIYVKENILKILINKK